MQQDDYRRAGLGHVQTWVFDLDNTLYPASSSLFPQIDARMRQFIIERLKVSPGDAVRLQMRYYREFGTSLRGLMLRHGVEPAGYLAYIHDVDCSVLDVAPRLDAALARLPGRKLIFTNGSERHAVNVLARLGISRHFEGIFDIAAARYSPKPDPGVYDLMLKRHDVSVAGAAMVEDVHRNLAPAAAIGMTTVWYRQEDHPDTCLTSPETDLSHVHHVTDDLTAWLEVLAGEGR